MEELYSYRNAMLARYASIAQDFQSVADHPPQAPGDGIAAPSGAIRAAPTAWSPHRILAHLRDAEVQVYAVAVARILAENTPTLEEFDSARWMEEHYRPGEPVAEILAEYLDCRGQIYAWVASQAPPGWCLSGRHPVWGRHTLQWWVERSLAHAEGHLAQLRAM